MRICDAAYVDATHQRIRKALVVGVDAASFTEIMLRLMGAKAVAAEIISAFDHSERVREHVDICCLPAFAKRAVATGYSVKTLWRKSCDLDRSAVAGGGHLETHLRFTFGIA